MSLYSSSKFSTRYRNRVVCHRLYGFLFLRSMVPSPLLWYCRPRLLGLASSEFSASWPGSQGLPGPAPCPCFPECLLFLETLVLCLPPSSSSPWRDPRTFIVGGASQGRSPHLASSQYRWLVCAFFWVLTNVEVRGFWFEKLSVRAKERQ